MLVRAKLTIALLLAIAVGCASRKCFDASCDPGVVTPVFDCQHVDPQSFVPDLSAVPPFAPRDKPIYCALPEQDVQCLAALHSSLANLLAHEADAIVEQPAAIHLCSTNRGLLRELILLVATHQRNQDSAAAMELFLRLVEAEAGLGNIDKQLEQVDRTLSDIQHLQNQGLLSPVSKSEVESQRLDLQHRQVDLQPTIRNLNERLAQMLNVELLPGARFWPEAQLVVDAEIPDAEEAAMTALAHRADLAAVRRAAQADPRDYSAAVQLLMQQVTGGLTSPSSSPRLAVLQTKALHNESYLRGEQLDLILSQRERQAQSETVQAVEVLAARLQQIDLTRQRLALAQQRIQSLEQQQQLTSGATFNLRKARSDALILEQSLLHDTIEWKLAVVKLKQAQGLLAAECGYEHSVCCE
jgi:hypothetical protein